VFMDMALIGELYAPDLALLPIGDFYTMGPREAAKACELLKVPRVIPMHWGTFPVFAGHAGCAAGPVGFAQTRDRSHRAGAGRLLAPLGRSRY
jgi:hypothetical protein